MRREAIWTAAVLLSLSSAETAAEPAFARLYKAEFGYQPSCNACHKDGGGTPLNAYGQQFKDAGMNAGAFAKIANDDADRDGSSNAVEAQARANPGGKTSTPANKGDWLDTASLIPREVQAVFPGVREYLPRDAVLTEDDIARAKTLGATLTKQDENTIYVPLQDKRPVGTAIIFPVHWQKQDFFLLLTTDRQLKIRRVQPLQTLHLPAAAKATNYAVYQGVAVDQLPPPRGSGLDAAIAEAVKKAGTLLYVRLKNA